MVLKLQSCKVKPPCIVFMPMTVTELSRTRSVCIKGLVSQNCQPLEEEKDPGRIILPCLERQIICHTSAPKAHLLIDQRQSCLCFDVKWQLEIASLVRILKDLATCCRLLVWRVAGTNGIQGWSRGFMNLHGVC